MVLWLTRVLGPLPRVLIGLGSALIPGHVGRDAGFTSEAELRDLVDLAEERQVIESREREMIHSVFELGETLAREVMVPRTDMVWIEQGKSVRQALLAGPAQRLLPDPGDRRQRGRRRRRRLPQGPGPQGLRRRGRRPRSGSAT